MTSYPSKYLELHLKQEIHLFYNWEEIPTSIKIMIPTSWINVLQSIPFLKKGMLDLWKTENYKADIFINSLIEMCQDIALVTNQNGSILGLLYILQHKITDKIHNVGWLGNLPASEQDISESAIRMGIHQLPFDYQSFVRIHNGFLMDGWNSVGIRSTDKIYFIDATSLKENENVVVNFNPTAILAFCGDGNGNEQSFLLQGSNFLDDGISFRWDHETKNIKNPLPFWEFIATHIGKQM